VNPITQAIAAAHAIAARAVSDGKKQQDVMWLASDADEPMPALDDALAELTGDELKLLAIAADALRQRARMTEAHRRNSAITAEIGKLKKKEV
jgi:hypothetical protein